VLVGHSYAGTVVAGVADRLPGRIAHLVYLDAAVAGDGQAVLDLFPPEFQAAERALVEAEGDGWRWPPPDPSASGSRTPRMRPGCAPGWCRSRSKPSPSRWGWRTGRVRGAEDVHRVRRRGPGRMARRDGRARPDRAGWRYRELATGHDAMITAPSDVADLLLEAARPRRAARLRSGAITAQFALPGERWELEFLADGTVEVERFRSDGKIVREAAFEELWSRLDGDADER
jgi:pimeloyl-ACP methyl ester carboxylesterase